MNLNVPERIALLKLLPKEGTFLNLKRVREARELIALSDGEAETLEIKADGRWNVQKDFESDIDIGDTVTDIVIGILTKMDKDGKLTDQYFSLYEKFVA